MELGSIMTAVGRLTFTLLGMTGHGALPVQLHRPGTVRCLRGARGGAGPGDRRMARPLPCAGALPGDELPHTSPPQSAAAGLDLDATAVYERLGRRRETAA